MSQKGFAQLLLLIGILIIGVVIGGVYYFKHSIFSPITKNSPRACTQEAKQCPDGSFVGRTGPNCEFTPCPEVTPSFTPDANLKPNGSADTANWKTFTDSNNKYSFKYPPNFVVRQSSYGSVDIVDPVRLTPTPTPDPSYPLVSESGNWIDGEISFYFGSLEGKSLQDFVTKGFNGDTNSPIQKPVAVVINGLSGYEFASGFYFTRQIYLPYKDDNYVYIRTTSNREPGSLNSKILSTFKFIP